MDDPDIPQRWKDNAEYIIDVSDPENHKLSITLKANETRSQEQRKLRDKIISEEKANGTYKNRIDKNQLIIYLDNVSRQHFIRKMPITTEWLSQFVDNDKSEYSTYQFFRYHTIFFSTSYSNSAIYYGVTREVDDGVNNMMEEYARNGYITGFAPDTCKYEFANLISAHERISTDTTTLEEPLHAILPMIQILTNLRCRGSKVLHLKLEDECMEMTCIMCFLTILKISGRPIQIIKSSLEPTLLRVTRKLENS
jgi:hypothetical protein